MPHARYFYQRLVPLTTAPMTLQPESRTRPAASLSVRIRCLPSKSLSIFNTVSRQSGGLWF